MISTREDPEGLHPYHILGDSAYPQKTYVVVPFRDNGHMSPDQKQFNNVHAASCVITEQSFARLKGKWRRYVRIHSNLHTNDNKAAPTDNKDKLIKLRPMIQMLNSK